MRSLASGHLREITRLQPRMDGWLAHVKFVRGLLGCHRLRQELLDEFGSAHANSLLVTRRVDEHVRDGCRLKARCHTAGL